MKRVVDNEKNDNEWTAMKITMWPCRGGLSSIISARRLLEGPARLKVELNKCDGLLRKYVMLTMQAIYLMFSLFSRRLWTGVFSSRRLEDLQLVLQGLRDGVMDCYGKKC